MKTPTNQGFSAQKINLSKHFALYILKMVNPLKINFLTLEEFNKLKGVNAKTSEQIIHGLKNPNLVAGKNCSKDSVSKTTANPKDASPSYTTNAVDCSTGILIASGAKLHSNIMFHLNPHKNLESTAAGITKLEKEFGEKLDEFFGHLDMLIRGKEFSGQNIKLDFIFTGGLIDDPSKDQDEFAQAMVDKSPVLKDTLLKMIQSRIAQSAELAMQHGTKLDSSRSIFWGQQITLNNQGKSISAFTNLHYDPATHTLSVSARQGQPDSNAVIKNTQGESTWGINHVADATSPAEIAKHYQQIELDMSHDSQQLANVSRIKSNMRCFDTLSKNERAENQAKWGDQQVQLLWQRVYETPQQIYNMCNFTEDGQISTGVSNNSTYVSISIGDESFGLNLDDSGTITNLETGRLAAKVKIETGSGNNDYLFTAVKEHEISSQETRINPETTVNDLAKDLKDPNKSIAFYTGAGLSIAAGIKDMAGYNKILSGDVPRLKTKEHMDNAVARIKQNPKQVLSSIKEFYQSFYLAKPSPAHEAIAELASSVNKPMPVFTENHDLLHQKTGINVMQMRAAPVMKAELDMDAIKNLDCIVCTGLSHDDRGFLAYLREINPNIKIIGNALPGQKPDFIDDENPLDIYLPGDAHEILPKLVQKVRLANKVQELYNFGEFLPPPPPQNDPKKKILESLYPNSMIWPFEQNILFGKEDYRVAWFCDKDQNMVIVAAGENGQYQEIFKSSADKRPYYGFGGTLEYRFHKPGEYIDFNYPLKHSNGKVDLDQSQTGKNYSIVRVSLKNPQDIQVVAFHPEHDVIDTLRDPESQEIAAYSYLDKNLEVKWQALNAQGKETLAKLEAQVRKDRGLKRSEPLSLEKIINQDGKTWTVYSSSATQALNKHSFKLENNGQLRLIEREAQVNGSTLTNTKVVKLKGANQELSALLISPKQQNKQELPTIIMAHGGPYNSFKNIFDQNTKTASIFAERGYKVLMINHSGSTDHGSELLLNISNNQRASALDIIAATKDAVKQDWINSNQDLHLFGHSYGAYTVLKAAELDSEQLFQSVVASSPIIDFRKDLEYMQSRNSKANIVDSFDNWASSKDGVEAENFTTPVLLLAGQLNNGDAGTLDQVHNFVKDLPKTTKAQIVEFEDEAHSPIHLHEMTAQLDRSLNFFQSKGNDKAETIEIIKTSSDNPESVPRLDFFKS